MADVLNSNLYPPIIDTFMPAFSGNSCKVYFELSDFNTSDDINLNLAQVSIRNQKNNENVLANPNGIRYYNMIPVSDVNDVNYGKYYIEISSSHLTEGFYSGLYYKVQIRFTSSNLDISNNNYYIGTPDNPNISWINNNLNDFSEWSTVCLIRQITEPNITTTSFEEISGEKRSPSRLLRFKADVKFVANEGECLSEYRLELREGGEQGTLLADSGIQYPSYDFPNRISYNFKRKMDSNKTYTLITYITSNNGYTKKDITTPITVGDYSSAALAPTIIAIPDPEHGNIVINFLFDQPASTDSYVVLTRTSNRSNFLDWEEIALLGFYNGTSNVFIDKSIESGIWYNYTAQLIDNQKTYSSETTLSEPVIVTYEDIFLNSQGKQLRLRFDSHVTSYKRTVLENKIETLGSPYPFIRRNSNTDYRQFSITGLISFHMDSDNIIDSISISHNSDHITTQDIEGIFVTEDELYNGDTNVERYHNYNSSNGIHPYNDYIKEREFRERVINFLNSGKVFLLRTMTEGLTLVRLMDINFTPKQELNNYIYSFTATAIEVDECNSENYYKYKVFPHLYSTTQLGG